MNTYIIFVLEFEMSKMSPVVMVVVITVAERPNHDDSKPVPITRLPAPLCWEPTAHRWFPSTKGQQYGPLLLSLLLVWTSCWTIDRVACTGNLICFSAHVTSLQRFVAFSLTEFKFWHTKKFCLCLRLNKNGWLFCINVGINQACVY